MDIKVGQMYPVTVTSSDPAIPIPAGTLVVAEDGAGNVRVSAPSVDNVVVVEAVKEGPFTVTFSCPGFNSASESSQVTPGGPPPPTASLVLTDGEVVG